MTTAMRTRVFTPFETSETVGLWRSRAAVDPFYSSRTDAFFDEQLLGSPLFDPSGAFLVSDFDKKAGASETLGFVVASFAPNADRNAPDYSIGVVYSPILKSGLEPERARRAEKALITAAEEYLRSKGAKSAFGGGCPFGAPLLTGLYGTAGPPGLVAGDEARETFRRLKYEPKGYFDELWLRLGDYKEPMNDAYRRATSLCAQPKPELWTSRANWWDLVAYRLFNSSEWRVYKTNGVRLIGGALTHVAPGIGEDGLPAVVLAYLGVNRGEARKGYGLVLTSAIVERFTKLFGPEASICAVVYDDPKRPTPLRLFLTRLGFAPKRRYVSYFKREL